MSLYIDQKFVGLLSSRLDHFTKKKENLYNFRCPFCGDSKKNSHKARGYIFCIHNNLFFKCHNCGSSHTLGSFIKFIDGNLYHEYQLERFRDNEQPKSPIKKPIYKFKKPIFKSDKIKLPTIESLPDTHFAKIYILSRRIHRNYHSSLYYCADFKKFVDDLIPGNEHQLKVNDPRIVIPFYNKNKELIAFQGRSLKDNELRYITIKVQDVPKIFGMERIDINKPIWVVEGPIDSLFLPNCIACAGSDLFGIETSVKNMEVDFIEDVGNGKWGPTKLDDPEYKEKYFKLVSCMPQGAYKNFILIFDNEKRNKTIVSKMEQAIDKECQICIWPGDIPEKDINDMILSGKNPEKIIKENIFSGLEARLKLQQWKK